MTKQHPKKYSVQISDGLHAMRTSQGDFLVWNPTEHSYYAWGAWHWHSEGRFRERYAEKLTRYEDE